VYFLSSKIDNNLVYMKGTSVAPVVAVIIFVSIIAGTVYFLPKRVEMNATTTSTTLITTTIAIPTTTLGETTTTTETTTTQETTIVSEITTVSETTTSVSTTNVSTSTIPVSGESENCCDGIDNDEDGLMDGRDSDCQVNIDLVEGDNEVCWWSESPYSDNMNYYSGWFKCPEGYIAEQIGLYMDLDVNDCVISYNKNNEERAKFCGGFEDPVVTNNSKTGWVKIRFISDSTGAANGIQVVNVLCSSTGTTTSTTPTTTQPAELDLDGDSYTSYYDCNDSDATINPGTKDVCNGIDDDCNPYTKDGSGEVAPYNTKQDGVCAGSKKSCVKKWVDDYSGVTGYEDPEVSCDGLDNDCDSHRDEDCGAVCSEGQTQPCTKICSYKKCSGSSCTSTSVDVSGTQTCQSDRTWGECVTTCPSDECSTDTNCTACGNGNCDGEETYSNCPQDCCDADCTAKNDAICHSECNGYNGCSLSTGCNGLSSDSYICCNSTEGRLQCCEGSCSDCGTESWQCCNNNCGRQYVDYGCSAGSCWGPTPGSCQDCGYYTCSGGFCTSTCSQTCGARCDQPSDCSSRICKSDCTCSGGTGGGGGDAIPLTLLNNLIEYILSLIGLRR